MANCHGRMLHDSSFFVGTFHQMESIGRVSQITAENGRGVERGKYTLPVEIHDLFMGLKIVIATPYYLSSVFMAPAQPFFQHRTLFPVPILDITESPSVSSSLPSAEQDIDTRGNWIHKET